MEPHKKQFKERQLTEQTVGEYDNEGFFNTPNGSFWDPDEVYFNREGFDSHQGYYDDNCVYIPGPGWDHYKQCYRDEMHDDFDDMFDDEDGQEDDGYGNYHDDDLLDEEKFLEMTNDIEKIKLSPSEGDNIHNNHKETTTITNQPQAQIPEVKKEEVKKEPEPVKPKTGLASLNFSNSNDTKAQPKKASGKK